MTGKERGDYIRELLFTLTSREEKVLRRYFGIQELERQTLEEIVKDDDVSSGQTRRTKNRGVREFRNRVIHVREILRDNQQGEFFNEKEDSRIIVFFKRVLFSFTVLPLLLIMFAFFYIYLELSTLRN